MKAKQGRTVSIGNQEFAEIRESEYFYVDKTDFIRQWWEAGDQVTLIARPRRFGKTLNMQMLESFFSLEYAGRRDLFEGLEIWKHQEYRELQGSVPVIALTFSDIKYNRIDATMENINSLLARLYEKFSYLLEGSFLNKNERNDFKSVSAYMNQAAAGRSLKNLCIWLKRYHGVAPIILLDEYDAPMQEAWGYGYWDDMCAFMRSFLDSTFKANPALGRGLLTGVTRVSKESIFSGLNNINVITTLSDSYVTSFGFTEKEVFTSLDEMGMSDRHSEAKTWYDGFRFGDKTGIYNPWSITNYLNNQKLGCYWANTSNNGLVDELIRSGGAEIKQGMEALLNGKTIKVEYNDQIDFKHLADTPDSVWNLLLATGYLTIAQAPSYSSAGGRESRMCKMKITNLETRDLLQSLVRGWFKSDLVSEKYNEFIRCLLNEDTEGMEDFLNLVSLQTFSFFDTAGSMPDIDGVSASERFYHGFVLGLLVDLNGRYELTSNRESGYGRYDVVLRPLNDADPAYVIEFKVRNKRREDSLEDTLKSAKSQIQEQKYAETLKSSGIAEERIHELGIAFEGKRCIIG